MFNEATNSADHDFPPFEGEPTIFVIASTPRSGSTLLGSLLWATQKAGRPHEYLHPEHARDFYNRWWCTDSSDYLRHLKRYRSSPNGLCGFKIHHYQLKEWGIEFSELDDLLDSPRYIFIRRQQKVRQAISLVKAEQTQQFALDQGDTLKDASYNYEAIRDQFYRLIDEEEAWERHFWEHGIKPFVIWYENLNIDYESVLLEIFEYLGVNLKKEDIVPPNLRKMSDQTTEEWVVRFHKERAKRGD